MSQGATSGFRLNISGDGVIRAGEKALDTVNHGFISELWRSAHYKYKKKTFVGQLFCVFLKYVTHRLKQNIRILEDGKGKKAGRRTHMYNDLNGSLLHVEFQIPITQFFISNLI